MTIIRKTFRIARGTALALGLAVILALLLGAASMAFAKNGDPWLLGRSNVATAITRLAGPAGVNGPMLQLINNNEGANDTALDLRVQAGEAPLRVNSTKKVANLNADRIDDREASSFANGVNGKATNADKLDGKDSTAFANGVNGKATNADKLDGKDSGEFVQNTGEMTFSVFDSWMSSHSPSDPVTVDHRGYWTTFARGPGGQTQSEVRLAPPLPSSLYGKSMLLTGMEICYDTSNPAVALSRVKLLRYSSTNGGGAGGTFVVEDNTPTDGNQCRMYSGTPQLMGTNSFAFLEMHVNWSETTTQTTFSIQRTTFFLEPSDTAAAPLE